MQKNALQDSNIKIQKVPVGDLRPAEYNPRTWDKEAERQLKESIARFGVVDPLLINGAPNRKGIVIGGHFRLTVLKEMGYTEVPVIYINIPDLEKEKELNLRLNRNTGEFDWDLLAKFDEAFLAGVGFTSEEMDDIFPVEETPEQFDLQKELAKLDIKTIAIKKATSTICGQRLTCGD